MNGFQSRRKQSRKSSAVAASKKFLEFLKNESLYTTCNYSILELETAYTHCKDIYYKECAHVSFFELLDNLLLRGIVLSAQKFKYGVPLFKFMDAELSSAPSHAVRKYLIQKPGESNIICQTCDTKFMSFHDWHWHMESKDHKIQSVLDKLNRNKKYLVADKEGVYLEMVDGHGKKIANDDEGRFMVPTVVGCDNTLVLKVKNVSHKPAVQLTACEMLQGQQVSLFGISDDLGLVNQVKDVCVLPGFSYPITIDFKPVQPSCYNMSIFIQFKTAGSSGNDHKYNFIMRFLQVHCKVTLDACDEDILKAHAPYKPLPKFVPLDIETKIVAVKQLVTRSANYLEEELPLKRYEIPTSHKMVAKHEYHNFKKMSDKDKEFLRNFKSCVKKDKLSLTRGNNGERSQYYNYFTHLLDAEEIQMEVDIRTYDMYNVSMEYHRQNSKFLVLKVPGLVECRPSILKGDSLFAKLIDDPHVEYQGVINEVRSDEVVLGFSNRLLSRFMIGCKFDVRFTFNRLPLKYMHRAVEFMDKFNLSNYALPQTHDVNQHNIALPQIRPYDRKLNAEQIQAVEHIVAGTSKPYPYLIFGPPGTGKTVTVVEAIKQIVDAGGKECHVLACATSNSAADLLCERLLAHLPVHAVLRLNASSRAWPTIPTAVQRVSNYDGSEREFYYPCKLELMLYTVVVSTTITAGRLATANFPHSHFTHIVIDEAGHAQEPDCLVPVAGISRGAAHLVLAGDPMQLGPVLRSPTAKTFHLDRSLLERLMKDTDYETLYGTSPAVNCSNETEHKYNPRYLTKLVRNYRSHKAILEYPNKEFYDGDLKACGDQMIITSLCKWSDLPTPNFPMIFHAVVGKDEREEHSPSFFNADEIKIVLDYVNKILEPKRGQRTKVQQCDIGVISPYRKQVQKISRLLERKKYKDVKVASVEEFQGQERLVIILSTVRSAEEYLHLDAKYRLGFLTNPKRLNVAVTRARALLIVVGNPYVLRRDPHWRRLLELIQAGGGWNGVPCELSAAGEVDILQEQLTTLKLLDDESGANEEEMTISMKTLIEEPEWTSGRRI